MWPLINKFIIPRHYPNQKRFNTTPKALLLHATDKLINTKPYLNENKNNKPTEDGEKTSRRSDLSQTH
jgi:hypothetical protein